MFVHPFPPGKGKIPILRQNITVMPRPLPFAWYRFAEEQLSAVPAWPVAALSIGYERAASRSFQWTSLKHNRFHPHWHLAVLTVKGHGLYHGDGRMAVPQRPGNLFLMSKGDGCAYGCDGDRPWDFYYLKFTGAFADSAVARLAAISRTWDAPLDGPVASSIARIFSGAHGGALGGHSLALAAYEVVVRLLESADPQQGRDQAWLRRLKQRVAQDLRGISVNTLAEEAGLSLGHFETRFKKAAGMTPHAFIVEARIQAAAGLLSSSARRVNEVARLSGFDDPGYFAKVFRKARGTTPEQWRMWHR